MRDEFPDSVKRVIAQRVNSRCSRPDCRATTSGPQSEPTKAINVGVAAHITAASEGGPRYNPSLSPEERRHPNNGIWLCQTCAKLVDSDPDQFPETVLKQWKQRAEAEAFERLGRTASLIDPAQRDLSQEELELLDRAAEQGQIVKLSTQQTGEFVSAGSQPFLLDEDPAMAARYLEALDSLCRRDLARHEGGALYRLTGTGFKIARAIRRSLEGFEGKG